ncbi:MAG: hypothetical protein EOO73_08020 [Myxococcales bacterium]|nr:MAG: hypothetical protein EOO73_08020 [Myxococcales bacterium]
MFSWAFRAGGGGAVHGSQALAGLLVLLAWGGNAQAQPASPEYAPEQVELDYLSSAGCPSKESFVREVTARIRRPVDWVAADGRVLVALSLSHTEGLATGRLEVARAAAPPTLREFTAQTCGEVASALALVVALALDPNARTEALPEPPPAVPVEEPSAPSAAEPAPLPAAAPSAAPSEMAAPLPTRRESPPLHLVAWLGPVAGVDAGYAPKPLVTFGVSLGARVSWGSWLTPTLQLTPLWGKTGSTGPAAALGSFSWAMARLEACPVDLRLAPWLGFSPCLAGEIGRLAARGTEQGVEPTAAERWWAASGVTAAVHLELGNWFVRLSGEGMFPVIRDEFVFLEPERTVHRPNAFAYGGRLGVGFRIGR